jgi:hypothetical protein
LNSPKAAIGGHLSNLLVDTLQLSDFLAGDAVLIVPVSSRISMLTGNLTGKFADLGHPETNSD